MIWIQIKFSNYSAKLKKFGDILFELNNQITKHWLVNLDNKLSDFRYLLYELTRNIII
jgi:hypothetical protein